jgi:cytoskeletal protein CcmA (bactofilin family)
MHSLFDDRKRETDMLSSFKKGADVDAVVSAAKEAMTPPPRPQAGPIPSPAKETSKPPMPSSIGSEMSIIGTIECRGPAHVYGRVEGEVRASELLIGEGAQIEGNIIAQEVTICGRVKGTVRGVRVKLQSGGAVEGDIFHRSLSIDESSLFEGSSRRTENPLEVPEGDGKTGVKRQYPAPIQVASAAPARNGGP